MFTAALFTIAKTWKQPTCPVTDEWKGMWYIYHELLLNHKQEWNNTIRSHMDGPRDDHITWSKRKTNIIWYHLSVQFSLSVMSDSATSWTAARQAFLSITNCRSPPKPMSIESVMLSNHLILCPSLLLLPSIFPSTRVFSNESALHIRWPKYWSFSFDLSPFNEHPGLISFRMDWLDFFAVQGTLKSLLQHHSSEASIIQRSAFFIVQLSHAYVTTGKTIALSWWTFVGKVMSLLFNMLSRS